MRIDGGTSVDERQSIVDNFNTRGIGQVFLLSTRAGGAGLNLIGANHLVRSTSCPFLPLLSALDAHADATSWQCCQHASLQVQLGVLVAVLVAGLQQQSADLFVFSWLNK